MTKTKLLLTGLLAGAVAFGTACKTDKGTTTATPPSATDAGTGGAGYDNPDRTRQDTNPAPEEGTREMEPGVHEGTHEQPGTGGTGLEEEPIDRTDRLGGESGEEPLSPGAPATGTDEDSPRNNESMPEPRR